MKIIINTPTKEDPEKVFHYVKEFCIDNFQEFEVHIEGTDLILNRTKKSYERSKKTS